VGCEETYSSAHECRARACGAHCSALAVRLEGRPEGDEFRFCYQCHKFHNLDDFRAPDGSLLELHNCYASQQRRLKRRKLKDALKAGRAAMMGAAVQAAEPVVGNPFLRTTQRASIVGNPFASKSGEKRAAPAANFPVFMPGVLSMPNTVPHGDASSVFGRQSGSERVASWSDANAARVAVQMVASNNIHAGGQGEMLLPGIPVDFHAGSPLATSFPPEPTPAASDLMLSLEAYLRGDA
jgi:hypothetical protein